MVLLRLGISHVSHACHQVCNTLGMQLCLYLVFLFLTVAVRRTPDLACCLNYELCIDFLCQPYIFSSFCRNYLFLIVSALFMECQLRYGTLPELQDSNAGIWPSCFCSGSELKWQLEPRLRTNSEMSTSSELAVAS